MSEKYTLVHEGLNQWINSPNNGGECCQTWADTVDELNRLLARIKRLEEAGNGLLWYFCPKNTGDISFLQSEAIKQWNKAKEARL